MMTKSMEKEGDDMYLIVLLMSTMTVFDVCLHYHCLHNYHGNRKLPSLGMPSDYFLFTMVVTLTRVK